MDLLWLYDSIITCSHVQFKIIRKIKIIKLPFIHSLYCTSYTEHLKFKVFEINCVGVHYNTIYDTETCLTF